MKVFPDSQSLCVSALGYEILLITLNLEVTKDLSLRALFDCGTSNNFVRCQSLEGRRLKFVERVTPPTRLTVRLAAGASIEKTRIERYTSQPWESLQANPLYNDLIEFKDVFPESVPCELPKDKVTRHKIELKPGSKYCT